MYIHGNIVSDMYAVTAIWIVSDITLTKNTVIFYDLKSSSLIFKRICEIDGLRVGVAKACKHNLNGWNKNYAIS